MMELVIIGAGDFGKEVAWLVEDINRKAPQYKVLGFLDDDEVKAGQTINGYSVLGDTSLLTKLNEERDVCAVIAMQDGTARKEIVERFPDFQNWETLIHPAANISQTSTLGKGCIVCAGGNISVNTEIRDQCVFNIGVTVGHDNVIEDYVSVMSGSVLSGNVTLKEGAYLGSNATIVPGRTIGNWARIGAGSVVLRNVREQVSVMGVPAKIIRF